MTTTRRHLGEEAARPLSDNECAALRSNPRRQLPHDDDGMRCVVPVPENAGMPPQPQKNGQPADQVFKFLGLNGELLGYLHRWNKCEGVREKNEFWPVTYWRNGTGRGEWRIKAWPVPRPLYGLDRLARKPEAVVMIFEGEKKVDAIAHGGWREAFTDYNVAKREIVAVSWPGGARSVAEADFTPLAGREAIVVPDNDVPGEEAADAVVEAVVKVGVRKLRRWHPPAGFPPSWDVADELPGGCDPDELVRSMLEAPELKPAAPPRLVLTLPQFLAQFEPPDYLIDGLLQHHYFYALTGMTGAGKTAVALLIAVLVATRTLGQKLGTHDVEHGRVVYITKENPTDVRMRLIGIGTRMNLDIDDGDFLVVQDITGIDKDMPRMRREIEAFGPVALVVVDTAPALFQGDDENSNKQMGDHARAIRRLCDLPGRPCVLALCHPTKRPAGQEDLLPRGGGSYLAELDGNLTVWQRDGHLTRPVTMATFSTI